MCSLTLTILKCIAARRYLNYALRITNYALKSGVIRKTTAAEIQEITNDYALNKEEKVRRMDNIIEINDLHFSYRDENGNPGAEVLKGKCGGRVSFDEIGLPVKSTGVTLPCGSTAIWEK